MTNKARKTSDNKHNRFKKVLDGKGKPVRGLWVRGSKYYTQMVVTRPDYTKHETKVPLKATNLTEAREAHRKLLVQRSEGDAIFYSNCPKFGEYAQLYLDQQRGRKAEGTLVVERGHIRFWTSQFGQVRLNHINPAKVRAGLTELANRGKSQRTCNLAITMLRNVLNMAITDHLIRHLPITKDMTPKPRRKQRALYTPEMLEQLCEAAAQISANGVQFCDFARLMAYSGGRMSETLRLRWADVDFERQTLCIGADGLAKGKEPRLVNFNPQLETHLKQMRENRKSEEWLFPSAQRGNEGKAAKSFRETLIKARGVAGQDGPRGVAIGFHDMRHLFASYCVMSGVDTMTIARWMGHKDGGKLICEVYAHLCADHLQRAAQQVHFGVRIIDCSASSGAPDSVASVV